MVTSRAKLEHQNEPGIALSYYNDDGWGKHVKQGKYTNGRFSDELVDAARDTIQDHLRGQFMWVTNVPSVRHPDLVPDFAQRLANLLHLPYVEAIFCSRSYPEQKTMQNSFLQLQNIQNVFQIREDLPILPVLLVDDIVDSGWSLTLIGWLLREHGVEKVYPFALAKAMGNLPAD